jgi:hypothetical protein
LTKRLFISLIIFLSVSSSLHSQYGSLELNTGGFSFVPIFTSNKPHYVLRAGTNDKRRFSLNLINLIMMDGLHPANYSLIVRYKLIDKKFQLKAGLQLPGYRLFENEDLRSRDVGEVRASYPINATTKLLFLYLHAEGKNFEMNNNFYSFYFEKKLNKWTATAQAYLLFTSLEPEPAYGVAQKVTYKFKDKININIFLNKSLVDEVFNRTLGLEFFF